MDTATGVTHLTTEDRPLHTLTPYPGNARRGDVPAILESLCANGQYRSVIVRDEGNGRLVVLAGNHTVQALAAHGPGPCGLTIKTGGQERPCGVCQGEPWEPTVRAELIRCDDDTARRIVLADNRTAELGTYDDAALADLLAGLDEDSLTGTGYSDADLEALLVIIEEVEEPEPEPPAETPQPPADAPASPATASTPATVPAADGADAPAPADTPAPAGALAPQFSHERVPMVLHYAPADREEAARLIAAARETFPGEEAPDITLRALRTLLAVLDSRHAHDGVVTVAALLKAAGVDPA